MQKNKYNIVVANPANNITVFVLDYVEKEDYKDFRKHRFQCRTSGICKGTHYGGRC